MTELSQRHLAIAISINVSVCSCSIKISNCILINYGRNLLFYFADCNNYNYCQYELTRNNSLITRL